MEPAPTTPSAGSAATDPRFIALDRATHSNASDITLIRGSYPWYRTDKALTRTEPATTTAEFNEFVAAIGADKKTTGAFRYTAARWRYIRYSAVESGQEVEVLELRRIPDSRAACSSLGIPTRFFSLLPKPHGLILVTGATGSGKSTTLAAACDYINQQFSKKILTLEDPIEHIIKSSKSLVLQAELGTHFTDWQDAIKLVLRKDPDVIIVGEMRDLASIAAAITLAETGHLVLGTLHTRDATGAIRRLTDSLKEQPDLLSKLSGSLLAVLAQRRISKAPGASASHFGTKIAVFELMIANLAVKNIILSGDTRTLQNEIYKGSQDGMIALDQSLLQLFRAAHISKETALEHASDPLELVKKLT